MAQTLVEGQRPPARFYGNEQARKTLDEVYPKISQEWNVQHVMSDDTEPEMHGCGMSAVGWRQIGHVFDPAFDPS